jgi:PatG Domain
METLDNGAPAVTVAPDSQVKPQACSSCGAASSGDGNGGVQPDWVYAIGKIQVRFPTISVEKELVQATARADTANLTDRQAMHAVLAKPENRYLVRKLCWIFSIEGQDTYILKPRDSADHDLLSDSLRAAPSPLDVDIVIGLKGEVAPFNMCNGLMLPILYFDQIYSFDRESLISAIPRPPKIAADAFEAASAEVFDTIMQMADNAGNTDAHRALNYCAVRYPAVYAKAAEQFRANSALTGIEVQPSALSGARRIVKVIFTFTNRATDVSERFFLRADVTEEFPFLVTKLSPYYQR